MHRSYSLPLWIGCSSLVLSLILHFGMQLVSAQTLTQPANHSPGQPSKDYVPVVEMGVGMSRAHCMSSRANLKRVENPNSGVVRVEKVPDSNSEVMLVGVSPGRTTVTFTDQNDRVEQHEFVVAAVAQAAPPQAKEGGVVAIYMQLPGETTKQIPSKLWGGKNVTAQSSNDRVLRLVIPEKQNVLLGLAGIPGVATVTVTDGKTTETFEFFVLGTVDDLQKTINQLVPTGSITVLVDDRTKTRVITGTVLTADDARLVNQIADQAKALSHIKIGGVQQVQLEVVIALVNRSELRNMSFSWQQAGNLWSVSSILGAPSSVLSAFSPPSLGNTGSNINLAITNNKGGGTIAFLNALRSEGLSKVLAEPRLTTLSGRPAKIQSGGDVQIISGGTSSAQISAKFGTIVDFVPIVLGNGKIHLEVSAELSVPTTSIPIPGAGAPGTVSFSTLKRAAQAAVQLEDGQTLVIGGLIQNTVDATIDRVPFLGDLPFIGMAFTSKSYQEKEEELVILVTPRLVDGIDCTKIPKYLPGRESRSPDDFELFMEGIMEAPRGPRNVMFRRDTYKPAFHGASNIGQIPCGDTNGYGQGGANCSNGSCAPASTNRVNPMLGGMQPMPSLPNDYQAMPVSRPRLPDEVERVPVAPPPGFIAPTSPTMPSREVENRSVLPSISPNFPR